MAGTGEGGRFRAAWSRFLAATAPGDRPRSTGEELDLARADPGAERLLERVRARDAALRYEARGPIARGGMSAVSLARDRELGREVAVKTCDAGLTDAAPREVPRGVLRFLDEARITASLSHPGIVPLHELGIDGDGHPFFTMKHVEGSTFAESIRAVHDESHPLTSTGAVLQLVRAVEAVAYAHGRGIVHRDLKPSNLMTGSFGEVYVMDWGLARGWRDAPEEATPSDGVSAAASDSDSLRRTLAGRVLGTPAYMAPERVSGEQAAGPRSDVYSLGAILYHLVTGTAPYSGTDRRSVLDRIRSGPPQSVRARTNAPDALASICERAMAREPDARYSSALELGDDLRRYVEGRVVRAHRTGLLAELGAFVRRRRALTLAVLVAGLSLLAATVVSLRSAERQRDLFTLATDRDRLEDLLDDLPGLLPLDAGFLSRAEASLSTFEELEKELLDLSRRVSSFPEAAPWLDGLDEFLRDAREQRIDARALGPEHGPGLEQRIANARDAESKSLIDEVARARWAECRASIAGPGSEYDDLNLAPQLGLLPLGVDPVTNLWEFAHLPSGPPAPFDPDQGVVRLGPEHGVVLVLLPGGSFRMGSQSDDSKGDSYYPHALAHAEGVHSVTLAPFFLAKHELTQAQWARWTGSHPSRWSPNRENEALDLTELHPVEQVSWRDARRVLGWMGLGLPTEAQWEYAARAGTTSIWWAGGTQEEVEGTMNVADVSANGDWLPDEEWADFDDGYRLHAPVDRLLPNPFGLYHVLGNVSEWCEDPESLYTSTPRPGDGLREEVARGTIMRMYRGGSFVGTHHQARSAQRHYIADHATIQSIGVRPARPLDPR